MHAQEKFASAYDHVSWIRAEAAAQIHDICRPGNLLITCWRYFGFLSPCIITLQDIPLAAGLIWCILWCLVVEKLPNQGVRHFWGNQVAIQNTVQSPYQHPLQMVYIIQRIFLTAGAAPVSLYSICLQLSEQNTHIHGLFPLLAQAIRTRLGVLLPSFAYLADGSFAGHWPFVNVKRRKSQR